MTVVAGEGGAPLVTTMYAPCPGCAGAYRDLPYANSIPSPGRPGYRMFRCEELHTALEVPEMTICRPGEKQDWTLGGGY